MREIRRETKRDDIDLFFLCSFENVVEKIKDLNKGLLLLLALGGISLDKYMLINCYLNILS